MNDRLLNALRILVTEMDCFVDEYRDKASNADSDSLEAYLTGRAGAYSVCRDLLQEVIDDAQESR